MSQSHLMLNFDLDVIRHLLVYIISQTLSPIHPKRVGYRSPGEFYGLGFLPRYVSNYELEPQTSIAGLWGAL